MSKPTLRKKLKTCFYVLRGWSVIFNVSVYGKIRLRIDNNLYRQNNRFYDDIVTDKVIVLPDDIPNIIKIKESEIKP